MLTLAVGCAAPQEQSTILVDSGPIDIKPEENIYIKVDFKENVNFQGQYSYDDVGIDGGDILYPAPTAEVFIASIIVHAITANSMNNEEKTVVQKKADQVLKEYEGYLDNYEQEELIESVLASINQKYAFGLVKSNTAPIDQGFVLNSQPVFFVSQDQRSIVLKHLMSLSRSHELKSVVYKNIVEVSSKRIESDDLPSYWLANDNLPILAGQLYAESLELFLDDVLDKFENNLNKEKTFRFQQNGKTHYERGTLVKHHCGQTTIRTLRGWLKSIPSEYIKGKREEASCEKASVVDKGVVSGIGLPK